MSSKVVYDKGYFQTTEEHNLDRADHIWLWRKSGKWKCILCGAVCFRPPPYRSEDNWFPETYELLTNEERNIVPFNDPVVERGKVK